MSFNRKKFIQNCLAAAAYSLYPSRLLPEAVKLRTGYDELIRQAGNTNSEAERVLLLKELSDLDIPEDRKEVIRKIIYVADHWANGFEKYAKPGTEGNEPEGYLCGFFIKCSLKNSILPVIPENNELFPLIAFYRSRMLVAQLIQSGNIINVPDVREKYLNESRRLMKIASSAFPGNELAKNYLGTYNPWEEIIQYNPAAPAWANYQRMVLGKLVHLINWWIDNRQISDGQFGGGWGDDVEMWRSWMPVLFAFNDEKATGSKEKLFEGLYRLSRMQKGYTTIMTDVEHTSEEYSDPLFCMLNMQPENPVWAQRALKVLDYIENLWTGINERGHLQFKSTWFNVEKVHPDINRACDTPYHTRLVQPLMYLWLRTGNKRIADFVIPWLKTWIEATFTAENGKPEGIIPAAIHWPDGKPAGMGQNWWQPENHTEPTLYYFPTQQSMMYECFLQAYHMTKDEYFLKPVRFVSEMRLQGKGDANPDDYQPGSLEWSLSVLKNSIPKILIKYRLITGDNSYDRIISKDAEGYEKFIFEKDIQQLTAETDEQRKSLSLPEVFYTSEVRWTDRLFASVRYFNFILDKPLSGFDPAFLFSCLTGSVGNYQIFPVFGVKWITPPTDIAILTEINSTTKFQAQLFHFGNHPRKIKVRFLNLKDGQYNWSHSDKEKGTIEINQYNREIEFTVPAQKLCKLMVILNLL